MVYRSGGRSLKTAYSRGVTWLTGAVKYTNPCIAPEETKAKPCYRRADSS